MSTAIYEDGELSSPVDVEQEWRQRIEQGLRSRKPYEPTWTMCLAFAAGQQWLKYDPVSDQLVNDPLLDGVDYYTADHIGEFRDAALGEMSQDDDRPQLLLVDDDQTRQDLQAVVNRGVGHGWQHEWGADAALAEARRYMIDLGTAAIRVRFDKHAGPLMQGEVPFQNGQPLLEPEAAREHVASTAASGGVADLRNIHEGRTTWEPLSAFNLIPPPGVPHERDFPWEIVVRPVHLDDLTQEYGSKARAVKEDQDIASVFGTSTKIGETGPQPTQPRVGSKSTRLYGHCWLYTCYERPCPKYQEGRIVVLAGGDKTLLDIQSRLDYQRPDQTYSSGIAYLHWRRVSGRFFSRGLVEPMKDPQRFINRRATQNGEIIDRGMPRFFVDKGSLPEMPRGTPVEYVELDAKFKPPTPFNGFGPGPWMYQDKAEMLADLEHATGFRAVSLGEKPPGVDTYSGLALLHEQESVKRELIYKEHNEAKARLVEFSVHDMKRYWPPGKQIMLASDESQAQVEAFNSSEIPVFFQVHVPTGSAKPQTQASQLKLIEQVWAAGIEAGTPLPLQWLFDSFKAGQPLDLPDLPGNAHRDKALEENHQLLQGQETEVSYYDPPDVHIPIHREAQIQADATGDQQAWQTIERHIQGHLAAAAVNAMKVAQVSPESAGAIPAEANGAPAASGPQPTPLAAPGPPQ